MTDRRVISGVRREAFVIWFIAVAVMGSVVLYGDITGIGLRRTLLFRAVGYMAYPVFYGGLAYLLVKWGRIIASDRDYLTTSGDVIEIGGKVLPIDGLQCEARRNWLGLRDLVFRRDGRLVFAVKAYTLSKPLADVIKELELNGVLARL
jgi:hypothetical protein